MQLDSPSSVRHAVGIHAMPLFHAAWLFALGIVATHFHFLPPSFVLASLAPIAILCAVAAFRAQRIAWLPLATLWLLLGAWCGIMEPAPVAAPVLASLSDGLMRSVEGTVIDTGPIRVESEQNLDSDRSANPDADNPTAAEFSSQRIDVRVASLEDVTDTADAEIPATGNVRLTVRWPQGVSPRPFQCGDSIRAAARLAPPETYHDPGVWSREDYLVDQGITSTASVEADRVDWLGSNARAQSASQSFHCFLGGLQHATTARLLALPQAMRRFPAPLRLTRDDAVMLAAMVAGDRTYLTHSLRVGFERTGSFHMLVVSGFHLAIVAGCIFWIARRLRVPRVAATILTILASSGYALFTGFATPVERSLWMVSLYLIGRLFYRERSAMNVIGFASLCLLAASPRSLFDASLQMTLLAVVAIAGVAAPLLQGTVHPYLTATRDLRLVAIDPKLSPHLAQFRVFLRMAASVLAGAGHKRLAWRVLPWLLRFLLRLVELLVVSCVAELAMALPMAVYFHRITLFALPVNLFILPLLAVLMPAALLTLVLLFVWPAAASFAASAVAVVLHLGVGLVHLFGSLTFGDLRIPTPLLLQSAAFCLLLAAAVLLAHLSLRVSNGWLRALAATAMLAAAIAAVMPRPIDHPRSAMEFEAIDVGQGDSLLIITPDGKTLLIDGGGFGGNPHQAPPDFDIGEEVVSPSLWARGIRHLDAVALSHAHADHMGGLPAVLRNFHPDELWVGNNPRVPAYTALLDEASALHVHLRTFRAGDAFTFGVAQVQVLAPFRGYVPAAEPTNNDSLVLRVAYGTTSVMLEGDAEAPIEQAMLAEPDLASTVLKVGHHGSLTSTIPAFLSRVSPQWSVISCGLRNRYGHPRQQILDELQSSRVRTFRTDLDGMSCFVLDGKTASFDEDCAWRQSY
jgi:competence protein ComEC